VDDAGLVVVVARTSIAEGLVPPFEVRLGVEMQLLVAPQS
jgi:hypothetical protein